MKQRIVYILALSFLLVAGGVACGSDDEADNPLGGGGGGHNGGEESDASDAASPDATDATDGDTDAGGEGPGDAGDSGDADDADDRDADDAGPDAGACDDGDDCSGDQVCHEGACVDETPEVACDRAEDLGTLTSETLTVEGSFDEGSDVLETSCASSSGPEKMYRFRVEEDSLVSHRTTLDGQVDAKLEFRDECTEQGADERCFDADGRMFAPADSEMWLVVERDVGRAGDFEIELEATEESCPMGERRCSDGELEICSGNSQGETYDCAAGCAGDSQCAGDVCSEAIDVTASTTFSGDLGAYSNRIDFEDEDLCALADGTNVPTPGNELVFRFPDLSEGQVIHVDMKTDDPNSNALFVLDSCQSEPYACEYVNADDEKGDWTVREAGTYYLVVDKLTEGVNDYRYAFEYK